MLTHSPYLGQVRLVPYAGYRPAAPRLGRPAPARRPVLGVQLSSEERATTLTKIAAGSQKMAQVRKWIASRIDQDPMLLRTFREKYISDNFWGYDDLVVKDQWYVDQTSKQLQSANSQDWDVPEENLARTDEWAQVIDIMHAAMQEYGAALAPGARPPVPGAVATPPPSGGLKTTDLLVGGAVAVGLGVLIAALA